MLYRKYLVIFINLIIAVWLIKTTLFPKEGADFFGVFLVIVLLFCFLYNIYAFLLFKFYFVNEYHKIILEIIFVLLLLLPFFVIWYFTS
jgi:hypothetical protein